MWFCHNLFNYYEQHGDQYSCIYISLWGWLFIPMEYIPISGLTKSTDIYIFYFYFRRHLFPVECHKSYHQWMDVHFSVCVAQERTLDFRICLFNFVSLMLVNWYIMSAFCVYWAHTFSFFYWPFSIFKCSVYDYVYNPSVFCTTNTFPKSIIYFWVWLWYQIR